MTATDLSTWVQDWGPVVSAIAVAFFTFFLWRATHRMAKSTTDVVDATASSVEAARASAEAAGASAEAAVGLFHLEQERWEHDRVRAASAEHWSAHVMPSGVRTAAKVVRIYNRGPGAANVQGVVLELENAGDPDIRITHSESYPVEVQAGEYFRVDLHTDGWRSLRAVVTWYDARGQDHPNVRRIRIQEPDEPAPAHM